MIGFGAGWRAHLEALRASVLQRPPVDRGALYHTLRESYARHIGD